jgi:hypothetical protein
MTTKNLILKLLVFALFSLFLYSCGIEISFHKTPANLSQDISKKIPSRNFQSDTIKVDPCPYYYSPVFGSDEKTYPTPCNAKRNEIF